jgi:uroporphyrinogen-III synthase
MVLLVTRPEPQASAWADALRQAGVPAQALPLIAITEPPRPDEVAQLWHQLTDDRDRPRALMFVSPAAVEGFFRLRPQSCAWPQGTLATAPGPGTAQVLLQAGSAAGLRTEHIVSPAADAEQFDSETLWPLLAPLNWQHSRVVIVSGGDASGAQGRTWLTERWREAGATVDAVQAYQRGPGTWTPEQAALAINALAQPDTTWLLSSSQALDFLLDHHLPGLGPTHWRPARSAELRLLCTHPRIAEHAAQRGVLHTRCCAPTLASVVQARRSAD